MANAVVAAIVVLALALAAIGARALATREAYEGLRVGLSELGRGVYTKKARKKGDVVEVCPLILRKTEDGGDGFDDYVFGYDDEHDSVPLGYCALYNHSETPNVEAETDTNSNVVRMLALRDIRPKEQLFMKYENDYFKQRGKIMQP